MQYLRPPSVWHSFGYTVECSGTNVKYDYGQEVLYNFVDENGAAKKAPCAIVGITNVETEEQEKVFGHARGSILYTIEFSDGTDRLVSESEITER